MTHTELTEKNTREKIFMTLKTSIIVTFGQDTKNMTQKGKADKLTLSKLKSFRLQQ